MKKVQYYLDIGYEVREYSLPQLASSEIHTEYIDEEAAKFQFRI